MNWSQDNFYVYATCECIPIIKTDRLIVGDRIYQLCGLVNVDDSTWYKEDGKYAVCLAKRLIGHEDRYWPRYYKGGSMANGVHRIKLHEMTDAERDFIESSHSRLNQ